MFSAISMFCTATDCVRDNFGSGLNSLLEAIGARSCPQSVNPGHLELPMLANLEKHHFEWNGARTGSVDLVRRADKPLQFIISLPYPKRRWLSPYSKDWKELTAEAESRFGPGHALDLGGKTGLHFRDQAMLVLISTYKTKKQAFIEIKMARDQFCY